MYGTLVKEVSSPGSAAEVYSLCHVGKDERQVKPRTSRSQPSNKSNINIQAKKSPDVTSSL
jgi:hypothetical protein